MGEPSGPSNSWAAIDSSNIGFQLLKKHGWKEGSGLGVAEQGRLEPVEAQLKHNKRGLGADRPKKKRTKPQTTTSQNDEKGEEGGVSKKSKKLSKKMRKMMEFEKHLQEKEFERAFFREFWPDNV
ncbi:PREDICTED: PIN2/TERF1-interacting telomerase inhibitor 1 [Tarenaya hassleriana]|uniref:PIN2/TERF1-interacting telomerase inhibitor 1 n=1 Tax=Tarenaya hassleriana TaxID=28532 RepID=UPI00053C77AE|nr:PREDICTED: PIN2/TERF1-interacting telomerase inhibitor 1 [Tarenaya hassleriana]